MFLEVFKSKFLQNQNTNARTLLFSELAEEICPFKKHCALFACCIDDSIESSILLSAEDFVFCSIAPFIYTPETDLTEVQERIKEGAKIFLNEQLFNESILSQQIGKFIYCLILTLSLNFSDCAEQLLEMKVFPVESFHICLVFKSKKLWSSPLFDGFMNEFIHLIPDTHSNHAIQYLEFYGSDFLLEDYLSNLHS